MPGAGKQPPEIQNQIRELLEAGFDPTTIHRKLKVGRSSIYRMKRCLANHGTAYMPEELNKKNGRPKVLSAEQELEVREWLRDPKNRNRYLDDLVWLIHDRFSIVCSTTTMSKLKRKWLKVIECEETGQPLDDATRLLVMETHPNLPILSQLPAPPAQMMQGNQALESDQVEPDLGEQRFEMQPPPPASQPRPPPQQAKRPRQRKQQPQRQQPNPTPPQQDVYQNPPPDMGYQAALPPSTYQPPPLPQQMHHSPAYPQPPRYQYPQHDPQIDARLLASHTDPRLQGAYHYDPSQYSQQQQHQFEAQLQQQLQQEVAGAQRE